MAAWKQGWAAAASGHRHPNAGRLDRRPGAARCPGRCRTGCYPAVGCPDHPDAAGAGPGDRSASPAAARGADRDGAPDAARRRCRRHHRTRRPAAAVVRPVRRQRAGVPPAPPVRPLPGPSSAGSHAPRPPQPRCRVRLPACWPSAHRDAGPVWVGDPAWAADGLPASCPPLVRWRGPPPARRLPSVPARSCAPRAWARRSQREQPTSAAPRRGRHAAGAPPALRRYWTRT